MSKQEETEEEQLFRVLKEMVLRGDLDLEERDGELYFSANEQFYDRNN